jgi:hypothetical protein
MLVKNSPLRGGHAREKICRQGSLARENQHRFPPSRATGTVPTISAKAHFHTVVTTRPKFGEPVRANKLERHWAWSHGAGALCGARVHCG